MRNAMGMLSVVSSLALGVLPALANDVLPDPDGTPADVYTNPLSKGGSSSGHYNKHAETYMNVGEGMGKAMAGMLKK